MPNWKHKAAVQGAMGLLPWRQTWNRILQKYVTKTLALDAATFQYKLTLVHEHVENYRQMAPGRKDSFRVLDIGTGWHPVIPVGLYLCGASEVLTIDEVSLLIPSNVRSIFRRLLEKEEDGTLAKKLLHLRPERLKELREAYEDESLKTPAQMLERINVFPIVTDARNTCLEAASVDFFVSNATFEHIPRDILTDILVEFRRLAVPGAVMSHQIDLGDHYRSFDPKISPVNFRKYSDFIWRFFNNTLDFHNRIMLPDYRKMHRDAGFRIVQENNKSAPPEVLDNIRLAKQFRHCKPEDLLVVNSRMISVPNVENTGQTQPDQDISKTT